MGTRDRGSGICCPQSTRERKQETFSYQAPSPQSPIPSPYLNISQEVL